MAGGGSDDLRHEEARSPEVDPDVVRPLGARRVGGQDEAVLRDDDARAGPLAERRRGAEADDRVGGLLVDRSMGRVARLERRGQ